MAASYWLTVLVTADQEMAIHKLFSANGWTLLKQVPKGNKTMVSIGPQPTVMKTKSSTDTEVNLVQKDNVPPVKTFNLTAATKSQILSDVIRRGRFITLEKRPSGIMTVQTASDTAKFKQGVTKVANKTSVKTSSQKLSSLDDALEKNMNVSPVVVIESIEKQDPDSFEALGDVDEDTYDDNIDDAGSDTNMSEAGEKQEQGVSERTRSRQKTNATTKSPEKDGNSTSIKESPNSKAGRASNYTQTTEGRRDSSVIAKATSDKSTVKKKRLYVIRTNTASNSVPSTPMVLVKEDGKTVVKKENETKDPATKPAVKSKKPRVYSKKLEPDFQHITEAKVTKNKDFELDPECVDAEGYVQSLSKYYCQLCKCLFLTKDLYTGHTKDGACVFACLKTGCGASFVDYFDCKRHCQEHVPLETLSKERIAELLEQRKQRNIRKKQLRAKMKKKKGQKPVHKRDYICETCGNEYKSLSGYLEHKHRKHTGGEPPYSCCEIPFFSRSHYMRHLCRIHNGPKPYLCDICGDGFAVNNDMQRHKLRHGTNKYSCNICGANYLQVKGAYEDHMAMHNKEQNHVCAACGAKFTHRSSLGKHKHKCKVLNKDQITVPKRKTKPKTKRRTGTGTNIAYDTAATFENDTETYIAEAAASVQPMQITNLVNDGEEQVVEHMETIYVETVCLETM